MLEISNPVVRSKDLLNKSKSIEPIFNFFGRSNDSINFWFIAIITPSRETQQTTTSVGYI